MSQVLLQELRAQVKVSIDGRPGIRCRERSFPKSVSSWVVVVEQEGVLRLQNGLVALSFPLLLLIQQVLHPCSRRQAR